MGLFDFRRKKEQPKMNGAAADAVHRSADPYSGDLEKTAIISDLVRVPQSDRDAQWQQRFLENIPAASFRCGDPQVISGPDGFPYFQLFLPEPGEPFQCFVIDRMKDDFLLSSGFGIVINPTASEGPDWVLSYGDIVNLHVNRLFYTSGETPFSQQTESETIPEKEEVMVGQPSEELLPRAARKVIASFLKMNDVGDPKVLLMMRRRPKGVEQDIVFNVTSDDFADEETCRRVMQSVSWYLPKHYSYVGMQESAFSSGFMPL